MQGCNTLKETKKEELQIFQDFHLDRIKNMGGLK